MLIYGAIIVSFLVTLGFFLFNKKEYTWWEFFIPTLATLAAVLLIKLFSLIGAYTFSETWGSTITSVFEEEPYNYWKHQTCSREVPCGTDDDGNTEYCTEYYDCSHQEDVGPSWWATTNIGEQLTISEKHYDSLLIVFGRQRIQHYSRNNYDDNDRAVRSRGTKFEDTRVGEVSYVWRADWPGTEETRKAVATEHAYKNKVKASDATIFNIALVTPKQADTLGLFQYPRLNNCLTYPTILLDSGLTVSKDINEKFRRLNGKFGPSNEMRLWVLVFNDEPPLLAQYQKNYWVKGNMNELVICMSVKDTTIQWVDVFSWTTNESLPIEIRDYITNHPTINEKSWNDLYVYLDSNLYKFKRRDFSEFDYLKKRNKPVVTILAYVFGILAAVGFNFWTSKNEFNDYNDEGITFRHNTYYL